MKVNERFVISEDYNLLPINIEAPSFATSNNCKQVMVMNTVISLLVKIFPRKSMGL